MKDQKTIVSNAIARQVGFEKYRNIMDTFKKGINISDNEDFKKAFNEYYIIRRNDGWRGVFYEYFDKIKDNKNISFEEIIRFLHNNLPCKKTNW